MNDRNRHSDSNRPRRGPSGSEGPSDGRLVEVHSQLSRDKDEPAEGFSLTPIFIVFLFCGFGFWAGLYLTQNSGNFAPSAFDLNAPKASLAGGPVAFEPDAAKGEKLFLANCAACHRRPVSASPALSLRWSSPSGSLDPKTVSLRPSLPVSRVRSKSTA